MGGGARRGLTVCSRVGPGARGQGPQDCGRRGVWGTARDGTGECCITTAAMRAMELTRHGTARDEAGTADNRDGRAASSTGGLVVSSASSASFVSGPLQCQLFAPDLRWQSGGPWRMLQGVGDCCFPVFHVYLLILLFGQLCHTNGQCTAVTATGGSSTRERSTDTCGMILTHGISWREVCDKRCGLAAPLSDRRFTPDCHCNPGVNDRH